LGDIISGDGGRHPRLPSSHLRCGVSFLSTLAHGVTRTSHALSLLVSSIKHIRNSSIYGWMDRTLIPCPSRAYHFTVPRLLHSLVRRFLHSAPYFLRSINTTHSCTPAPSRVNPPDLAAIPREPPRRGFASPSHALHPNTLAQCTTIKMSTKVFALRTSYRGASHQRWSSPTAIRRFRPTPSRTSTKLYRRRMHRALTRRIFDFVLSQL
jgi:hypothetical protein